MITLNLQTFKQSSEGGNVTGVICVELESGAFPAAGWSDFPVIILSWWIEAWLQLETPTRRVVQWRFMEGPHSLTLTRVEGVMGSDALAFARVESFLLEAAERVVSHCSQHRMFSEDLETLRMNMTRLKMNQTVERTGASHIEIRPSLAAERARGGSRESFLQAMALIPKGPVVEGDEPK